MTCTTIRLRLDSTMWNMIGLINTTLAVACSLVRICKSRRQHVMAEAVQPPVLFMAFCECFHIRFFVSQCGIYLVKSHEGLMMTYRRHCTSPKPHIVDIPDVRCMCRVHNIHGKQSWWLRCCGSSVNVSNGIAFHIRQPPRSPNLIPLFTGRTFEGEFPYILIIWLLTH